MHESMTIGQLAAAAAVNIETVRYYQRRGLLTPPERPAGRIGRYPPGALTRLRFIKRSQSLGFSLDEVQALLSLDDGQHCTAASAIGEGKLADVRHRIRTPQALEVVLQQLVTQCGTANRTISCPLIDALMQSDAPLVRQGLAWPGQRRVWHRACWHAAQAVGLPATGRVHPLPFPLPRPGVPSVGRGSRAGSATTVVCHNGC